MPAFKIRPIPLFEDNYCWRIDNESNMTSVVVDPAIAATVLSTYGGDAPELVAVLTTHYHGDHSGGNEDIAKRMPDIDILGGAHEAGRVPAATRAVTDGEEFELAGGMRFKALHTPCHTKGHICYVLTGDPDRPPAGGCACANLDSGLAPGSASLNYIFSDYSLHWRYSLCRRVRQIFRR
jgi:hydroxyacylglutathione hydrolase